ncbi:MBL fold metallo-hydrolase [Eubacteriales bacterium OttesenSCG-928-K08]|nr:MBL fold metallo-hydrolase [Eubacteriales bacterium OttesenSCG-928-K08]
MELIKLKDNIYYSPHEEKRDRPVLGYIRGKRYSVMVDAGASAAHISSFYSALSCAGLPMPEYTAITHWHWDHTFGMCAVEGKTIAHVNTQPKLMEMRCSDDVFSYGDERMRVEYSDAKDISIILPNILFDGNLVLNLGDISCHIISIPSPHSDDASAIWIPEGRALFLGDATSPDYFNGGVYDAGELHKMAAWLEDRDFDVCLLGHSAPLSKAELMEYLHSLME